jgi:hypothetical protein
MIIKIFKISTMEMWILRNKKDLVRFIEQETCKYLSLTMTIDQLVKYLPVENYCRVE